jgi:hypothetical protein
MAYVYLCLGSALQEIGEKKAGEKANLYPRFFFLPTTFFFLKSMRFKYLKKNEDQAIKFSFN